jgi:hypothetical protein
VRRRGGGSFVLEARVVFGDILCVAESAEFFRINLTGLTNGLFGLYMLACEAGTWRSRILRCEESRVCVSTR